MHISEWLSFTLASFLLALTPGPDVLLVLTTAAARGWRKGLALTLGLSSGVMAHTALVAFGVAAILVDSPMALLALRFFGVGYLLYLAWQSWESRAESVTLENRTGKQLQGGSLFDWYRRGIIMNISNPKVLLFFLAFLPEFAHPDRPGFGFRVLVLGAIFMAITVLVFGMVAVLSAKGMARWVDHPRFNLVMSTISTGVFLAVAVWLLLF